MMPLQNRIESFYLVVEFVPMLPYTKDRDVYLIKNKNFIFNSDLGNIHNFVQKS